MTNKRIAVIAAAVLTTVLILTPSWLARDAGAGSLTVPPFDNPSTVLRTRLGTSLQQSGVPMLINFQGELNDAVGDPVPDGDYSITFTIYDADTGDNALWSETQMVAVNDGLFSVLLGSQTALTAEVFDGDPRWMGVQVESDDEMTPRQRIVSVAYAIQAEHAVSVPWSGLTGVPSGFADGVDDDTTYTNGTGLTLSGDEFSLVATYRLPQTCSNGQIAEWSGGAWNCGDGGSGDITAVYAGDGLTGGGDGSEVTLTVTAEIARDSEITPTVWANDGAGSELDADLLDGEHASAFADASHNHSGDEITSGTVADARIAAAIARDSEITPTVWANDGAGGGLDADLLDGEHASAFADASHNHSGDEIASGTVADARIAAAIARDSEITPTVWADDGAGSGLDADLLDGLQASAFATATHAHPGSEYQNVVVVAKSGGDYDSVQAAVDSVGDASAGNAYLVWVAPGVYSETVTMKPYVHLQGAGQEATVVTSTASNNVTTPTLATLVLTHHVSLRDLTVGNSGAVTLSVALLALDGTTQTLVADVTARAMGNGIHNCAILLDGNGTDLTLQNVTALAENGSYNFGLHNKNDPIATLRGGSFTARGGIGSRGIHNTLSATLKAENVIALAENGSIANYALGNTDGAMATICGGSFTGRGGNNSRGFKNVGSGTILKVEGVTALVEDSLHNFCLINKDGATATLRGGSFTARGESTNSRGIANSGNGSMLEVESVTALAKDGSTNNDGLYNYDGATVILRGGSFTARGGSTSYGINNTLSATLDAENVTALAEDGSINNYSLYNHNIATATLRGGSFTARGGDWPSAIHNTGGNTTLEAESVTALAENSSSHAYGMVNTGSATATLRGGSFVARGAVTGTRGVVNADSGTTLEVANIATLAENGNINNYGLVNENGATATLRGSSFTARGGNYSYGINNTTSATLQAESVTALAENGNTSNIGLNNNSGATVHGGFFTGYSRESGGSRGIQNAGSGATLEATNITALGENSSTNNSGLSNLLGATATLCGSSFTGRGGNDSWGILNDDGSILEAKNITALGEDSSGDNQGLYNLNSAIADVTQSVLEGETYSVQNSSTITVSNSRLVGGAASGSVICVLVTRGATISTDGSTCP